MPSNYHHKFISYFIWIKKAAKNTKQPHRNHIAKPTPKLLNWSNFKINFNNSTDLTLLLSRDFNLMCIRGASNWLKKSITKSRILVMLRLPSSVIRRVRRNKSLFWTYEMFWVIISHLVWKSKEYLSRYLEWNCCRVYLCYGSSSKGGSSFADLLLGDYKIYEKK